MFNKEMCVYIILRNCELPNNIMIRKVILEIFGVYKIVACYVGTLPRKYRRFISLLHETLLHYNRRSKYVMQQHAFQLKAFGRIMTSTSTHRRIRWVSSY